VIHGKRHGLALPAAVFALAVIMLFIAGSAFATTQESRASLGSIAGRLALEAAEYGAVAVLRDWDPAWNVSTPVGQTAGPVIHVLGAATSTVRITRTTPTTWWVVSVGSAGGASKRRAALRTVNATFRLDMPPEAMDAALGAADSARVLGTGMVIGTDSVEALPGCDALATTAGVAAPDTTRVCDGACGIAGSGIIGVPPLLTDSSVTQRVTTITSAVTPDIVLPAGAIVTPSPVAIGSLCDTLIATNWGDPGGNGACRTHMPVISALGDLTVRGGVGQGIIVASGDVRFENGTLFAGLVIAADDFLTGTGGGTVLGAVLAGDVRRGTGDHTRIASAAMVRRASCRIRQARLAAATPVRVRDRWWAEFD
jgi:hypothetical protein